MAIEVQVEDFRELVIVHGAREHDLHRIGQKTHGMMIALEFRVFFEKFAFVGFLDVAFDSDQTVTCRVEEFVEHLEQFGVGLAAVGRGFEQPGTDLNICSTRRGLFAMTTTPPAAPQR